MKKLLAILLSVIMVLSLVACGNKTQDDTPSNDDQQQNTETETKTIKVGLICIGDENDQGYTYNFIRGKEAATEALAAKGINVDWVVKYNIGEDSTCEDANIELAEEGCQLIINNSYGFEPFMLKVAPDYPEIEFISCTNQASWNDGLDNTHNAFANIYEGRYLAGVAAGMKMQELIDNGDITADQAVIGYVGAYSFAEVISGFTAYYLGAKSVNPEVTMLVNYTNQWADAAKEAINAQVLIDQGCDVIAQHSDTDATATTAEINGVFAVGCNEDWISVAPNAALVSARVNWGAYYTYALDCLCKGEAIAQDWCGTYAEKACYLSDLNEAIAAEGTKEAIEVAAAGLADGSVQVFSGPLYGVDADGNELNLAEGEFYEENKDSSSPSFAYVVDGITVLS